MRSCMCGAGLLSYQNRCWQSAKWKLELGHAASSSAGTEVGSAGALLQAMSCNRQERPAAKRLRLQC